MTKHALNGKSAFVTGGAKRIGRQIALSLAHAGADITITYRSSKTEARKTAKSIEALGRKTQVIALGCTTHTAAQCIGD